MKIYIPSRGRLAFQPTWDLVSKTKYRDNIFIVCPESEADEHRFRDRNVIVRPVNGINNVRQWICEMSEEDEIIMMDDDLGFFVRADPAQFNLKPAQTTDIENIIHRIYTFLKVDRYAHAGLSPRQMNNVHFPLTETEGFKMNAVHGINRAVLQRLGIKYNDVQLMEDYYITLSLFRRGYPNRSLLDAAWDQRGVSGAAGGCSTYRTAQLQTDGANRLHEEFPDFVKVVIKSPKGGWGDGQKERTDVNVQWKKCLKAGIAKYGRQMA
jgi:hypothetical protein